MTCVPAYWGVKATTPKKCPLGIAECFRISDKFRYGYESCKYYRQSSEPTSTNPRVGPVTVMCSAPTKATKGRKTK